MPICDYCDGNVDKVYECKSCGAEFCSECGSVERRLCRYCVEESEEDIDIA